VVTPPLVTVFSHAACASFFFIFSEEVLEAHTGELPLELVQHSQVYFFLQDVVMVAIRATAEMIEIVFFIVFNFYNASLNMLLKVTIRIITYFKIFYGTGSYPFPPHG
jgi:hypothetical protein